MQIGNMEWKIETMGHHMGKIKKLKKNKLQLGGTGWI
jgi:hypothetical protein